MNVHHISIRTSQRVQMINIDSQVNSLVEKSGVQNGLCVVFVPHTTAGVTINENADPDVVRDMIMELNKVIPFNDSYAHYEGNSAAHIKTTLVGPSITLIIENGRLAMGTWQSLYFCEFDGARNRKYLVKIVEC